VVKAVLIVPNYEGVKDWEDSIGTVLEIKEAERLNIPVFYSIDDLIDWSDDQQ